jgi:hypothetical protein
MRLVKILAIVALVYVGIVVAFESMIGWIQPMPGATALVITTVDAGGASHDRVVSRLEVDGRLYVAANHWPRAWYTRALANPDVTATVDGVTRPYRAVPVDAVESALVADAHPLGPIFRVLTGFPTRVFVRLDPRDAPAPESTAPPAAG